MNTVFMDVSQDCTASIFRFKKYAKEQAQQAAQGKLVRTDRGGSPKRTNTSKWKKEIFGDQSRSWVRM
jgi:hypothetical protein